jgi:hypothetical protein
VVLSQQQSKAASPCVSDQCVVPGVRSSVISPGAGILGQMANRQKAAKICPSLVVGTCRAEGDSGTPACAGGNPHRVG